MKERWRRGSLRRKLNWNGRGKRLPGSQLRKPLDCKLKDWLLRSELPRKPHASSTKKRKQPGLPLKGLPSSSGNDKRQPGLLLRGPPSSSGNDKKRRGSSMSANRRRDAPLRRERLRRQPVFSTRGRRRLGSLLRPRLGLNGRGRRPCVAIRKGSRLSAGLRRPPVKSTRDRWLSGLQSWSKRDRRPPSWSSKDRRLPDWNTSVKSPRKLRLSRLLGSSSRGKRPPDSLSSELRGSGRKKKCKPGSSQSRPRSTKPSNAKLIE